jgi:cell wall-associated NlpC family hydrolase
VVTGTAGRGLTILAEPDGGASLLGRAPEGAAVLITAGQRGDWYGVRYGELDGWAYGLYLQPFGVTRPVAGVSPTASSTPIAGTAATSSGNAIVSAALRYLGAPYVWGGNTPNGWDCSGFVVYVYREVTGRTLPRTTQTQWTVGTPVDRGALQAGDLVFFQNTNGAGITHVGIALGDGRFVHASSPRVGTIISSLSESYYAANYVGARRP